MVFVHCWLATITQQKDGGLVFSMIAMKWTLAESTQFHNVSALIEMSWKYPSKNESTWKYLNVPESTWKYFYIATTSFQGGGRKKKFAEDEDFDDSEEGSEMSDSEFEDPDEMEVGLNVSNPKLCVPCVLLNMFM